MIIGSGIIIALIALGILFLIGLFNKKIECLVRIIFFYLRKIRINRRNMRKLPKTARKIFPVLKGQRGRGLMRIKIFKNYQNSQEAQN